MRNLLKRLPKSFGSAFFQVALIFLGVTLAIGFGNWNTARLQMLEEQELLLDVQRDLELNVIDLEEMIRQNTELQGRIDSVLSHLERRDPMTPKFARQMFGLNFFSSPYLSRSAYETAKSRGIHLITDREIRRLLVRLYESTYGYLKDDIDHMEWVNFQTGTMPLINSYVELLPDGTARIADYDKLLDDVVFRNVFSQTQFIRIANLATTSRALAATQELLMLVEAAVSQNVDG